MIQDNIKVMADYDATDTVVMANDTIVESKMVSLWLALFLTGAHMFCQTPQTLPH